MNPHKTGKLRVLDLFSGIGGFSLGLERTGGFETVAFCENAPYPRAVLKKHWPKVPCYEDVRTLTADTLARDGIAVDVICGGFPCQDISFAGAGAGLAGERSGLWREYSRLIGELRPRFVIVENVSALLSRGLGAVLGDMAALGYDAEWHCIPASVVGAPHRRDRVWIIAHTGGQQHEGDSASIGRALAAQLHAANAEGNGWEIGGAGNSQHDADASCSIVRDELGRNGSSHGAGLVADAECSRLEGYNGGQLAGRRFGWLAIDAWKGGTHLANSPCDGRREDVVIEQRKTCSGKKAGQPSRGMQSGARQWLIEPDVGRVAHGVPSRVDRLKGLGNAVVPQIPELIGRAILEAEGMT